MQYGFFTGDLLIRPYINVADLRADLESGVIVDATRRNNSKTTEGCWIVPAEQVEAYYRSKDYIPESIIRKKLKELNLLEETVVEPKKSNVPQLKLAL